MRSENEIFTPETLRSIIAILKKGNNVELKKENGNIVIVEIERKVKSKRPL